MGGGCSAPLTAPPPHQLSSGTADTPTPRQRGVTANRRREKSGRGTDPLQPPCEHESPAETLRNAHNGTLAGVLGARGGTRTGFARKNQPKRGRRKCARRWLKLERPHKPPIAQNSYFVSEHLQGGGFVRPPPCRRGEANCPRTPRGGNYTK